MKGSLLIAVFLSGCSLFGLSDFDVPRCRQQSDCEPINTVRGIDADACERWQCDGVATDSDMLEPGACVLRTRDDDGDGVISVACGGEDCDDARSDVGPEVGELCDARDNDCDTVIDEGEEGLVAGLPREAELVASSLSTAAVAEIPSTEPLVALHDPTSAALLTEWANPFSGEVSALVAAEDADGTTLALVGDFAFSAYENGGFAALRTQRDCALRVGRVDANRRVRTGVGLGAEVRDPVSAVGANCEPAAAGERGSRGTLRLAPSLAAGDEPEALLAYLDTAKREIGCAEEAVPVMAMVLFATRPPGPTTVIGTEDGEPSELGRSRATAHPGVVSLPDGRYLVAFSDESGALVFSLIERPEYNETDSFALVFARVLTIATNGAPIDDVALALGREEDGAQEIGVAYREGCGDDASQVFFARLVLEEDELSVDWASPSLGRGAQPSLTHTPGGMVSGDIGGGYWMIFDRVGPKALRFPDALMAPIESAPIELGPAAERDPLVFALEGAQVGFTTFDSGTLRSAHLTCP